MVALKIKPWALPKPGIFRFSSLKAMKMKKGSIDHPHSLLL
jgi:hypothetical protein